MMTLQGLLKCQFGKASDERKKLSNIVPPMCAKHHCEMTDFRRSSWNVVACRQCIDLESIKPIRRQSVRRREAVNRSSDLIFKLLADEEGHLDIPGHCQDDQDDRNYPKVKQLEKVKGEDRSASEVPGKTWVRRQLLDQMTQSMGNVKNSADEVRRPAEIRHSCTPNLKLARDRDSELADIPSSKRPDFLESEGQASATFVHTSDSEAEQKISVNGLLGQVFNELCDKNTPVTNRQSRPISTTEYVKFVRKACVEDPDLGSLEENDSQCNVNLHEVRDEISELPVAKKEKKKVGETLKRQRQSFTALVHLSDQDHDQLLSVHGLLGRVFHQIYEKQTAVTNRESRHIPMSEYVTFMRKACEEDPSLGRLESNNKERWILDKTFAFDETHSGIKSATAISSNINGDFAIADRINKRVVVFDAAGHCKLTLDNPDYGEVLCAPCDIASNSKGDYVVVDGTKSVKVYDSNGRFKRRFATKAENAHPTCIAVDQQDRVLVGDKRAMMLTLHKVDGDLIRRIRIYVKPNLLAVNSNGDIFISNLSTGRVHGIDSQGTPTFSMDTVIEGIRYKAGGLCCDITNDIYIALHSGNGKDTNLVCRFSPQGKLLGCVARHLCNPQGLCFTSIEKLMVTDGNCVKQYIMK